MPEKTYRSIPINIENDSNQPSRTRSLLSAYPRGFVEEVVKSFGMETPEQAISRLKEGFTSREEKIKSELQKILPVENLAEEKALQRAGRLSLPLPGAGPVSTILRSLAGGLLGQTGEEIGLPPILQSILESAPFMAKKPSLPLQPTKKFIKDVEQAKKLGLTEREITGTLQNTKTKGFLSEISHKGRATEKALLETQSGINRAYENLTADFGSQKIPQKTLNEFISAYEKDLMKLPADVRSKIKEDFLDFQKSDGSLGELFNLWKDINSKFGGKGSGLQKTKEILRQTIKKTNPAAAENFEIVNNVASKFADFRGRMAPGASEEFIDITEKLALANAIVTKNSSLLGKTLGLVGARYGAEQLLTNPKLQFLGKQFLSAAKKGSLRAIVNASTKFSEEVQKSQKEEFAAPRIRKF